MGRVGLDTNAPDFEKDKGKLQAGVSGTDVNGPSGNVRWPKANIHDPSADLNLPSKKKPRGNCFSCAGDADKDEPYRRGKGNAQFDLNGPDFDGSLEMAKPAIEKPNADIGGKASGPDFDLDSPDVNVSAKKPKIGLKSSELDASKAGGSGEIDIRVPDLSYGKPKISGPSLGKSDKDIDIRGPDLELNAPDVDASANTPDTGFSPPEFDVSRPGGSVKIGSVGLDANAPDLEKDKGKRQAGISRPDVDVPSGNIKGPKANIDGPSADLSLPSKRKPRGNCLSCAGSTDKDEPYRKATGKPKFDLDAPDVDGSLNADIGGRVTGPEFDMSTPDVDISSKKPKIGLKAPNMDTPNVGSSEININRPDFEATTKQPNTGFNVLCADIGGKFSGPEFDMDTPDIEMSSKRPNIGLKAPDVDTPNVGGSGEIDINGPDFEAATKRPNTGFNVPNADIGGKLSGPEFDMDTPDIEISSKKSNIGLRAPDVDTPNVGKSGEIDVNGTEFSFDEPKVSGLSIGKTIKGIDIGKPDFDVNTPNVDPATKRSNIGFDFPGFGVPKPKDTGEMDLNGPDFSYEKPKISGPSVGHSDEDINIRGPDLETDTPQGPGDLDISVPSLDGGISWPSTSGGELDVEANLPDMDISKNKPRFGIDTNLPGTNGLEGDQTGNVGLNLNRPDLDATSKPRFGVGSKGLEISGTDVTFPSIDKTEPSRSEVNAKFDWDINTSTPKVSEFNKQLKEFSPGDVEIETSPVEGDISVVNTYENFQLQSTPQSFPSATYDEPRSLQRYDEIRPEMELRLLSPKDSDQSQPKFNFEIPDASPASMTLVKVEENVTVCSASVDEDKPSSPTYRTLTLDREVKQKIEIVFPAEEDSKQPSKLRRSTSSSSATSSSSDAEDDKEKKPKGKKKSRQFKAFRKSSSSSASSKNGDTPAKRKEKDRKVSSSSSSSDDERIEKKKRPSKSDALPVKTIKEKQIRIGSSSSSSDEAPSVGQQKDLTKRKGSTSSSSSSNKESHKDGKHQLEHEIHPFVIAERKKPEEPVPISNTIQGDVPLVLHSVEPVDPDTYFVVEKPDEEIKLKDRRSSTSSSSDEKSKPPVAYRVEYNTHPQQYLIEPEKKPNPIFISSADVQEDAPEVVLYSVKPVDPDFSSTSETQTKQKERRISTSSSSSSGDEASIDTKEAKATDYHGPQTVEFTLLPQKNIGSYDIKPLDEQATPERKSSTSSSSSDEEKEVPKRKSSTSSSSSEEEKVPTRKRSTSSSSDDKEAKASNFHGPQTVEFRLLPQTNIGSYDIKPLDEQAAPERKNSTSSSSPDEEKEVPKRKIPSSSSSSEGRKVSERKSSTSSSSSEDVDLSPALGLTVSRYETVHHVITPDYPPTKQETESLEMSEKPFVVVSRSIKRPDFSTTAADEQDEPYVLLSSTEVQMSRPPMDVSYHLEYPSNRAEVEEDKDAHVQEEGIVPIFKSPSEDHDVLKVSSALLELPDEEKGAEPDIRASPTWDIQTHTFQTVYHVTIPDNPARDEDSQEIQEFSPTVVYRSVKKTTPLITSGDDDLEEEPQVFISPTDVQFSEPSYDFQLEYPENDKVSSTDVQDVPLTDEELIKRNTFEKETPDISALLASFDHPGDESQQSGDSLIKTEDEEKSPQEISPKDIKRRGSNSRLWDLMQGYLIEQPILDGGEPNIESKPENNVAVTREKELKVEIAKSVPKVESSVFELNQQTTETVFEVTQPSKLVSYKIHLDDKEPSKEVITSTTKVESSVAEVTPKASKYDPIYFQVDVGAKKPVSKESTSSWRKEDSGLVDVDDKEDPWMRHYSKGLQHGSSYHGSPSPKSPEIETSFAQSRSLSLSKVPHVKGIRTSVEKERGRPRYSIEGRTSAEPPAYRGTTERRPLLRELEALPRVRPTEAVFSIKDDKHQPQKSQTSSTTEESSREKSDSGPSVRSLRALWDK